MNKKIILPVFAFILVVAFGGLWGALMSVNLGTNILSFLFSCIIPFLFGYLTGISIGIYLEREGLK